MFQRHRVKLFVYCLMAIDLAYPLLISLLKKESSFKAHLLEGTLLTSLILHVWTLYYPHKLIVYYLPQTIGVIAKLTDMLAPAAWRKEVAN